MGKWRLHHARTAGPCWGSVTVTPEMLGRMPVGPSFSPVLGPPLTPLPKRIFPSALSRRRTDPERRRRPGAAPAPSGPMPPRAIAAPRQQNATLVGLEPTTFE